MAAEDSRIAVYSLPDLKNTTDDALPNYLTSIGFSQSQALSNLRLAIQSVMVILAAVIFYLDYTRDWLETKGVTFWAVGVYFTLSVVVTGLVWLVEKGLVFQGRYKGEDLTLRTRIDKHDPTYHVTFSIASPTSSTSEISTTISTPFSTFFDSEGHFVAPPFQSWLARSIPLVGTADPARAIAAPQSDTGGSEIVTGGSVEDGPGTPMKRKSGKK
ncbi:MAG: hypothetical protein M1837_003914 [Sclerophora amabilis]|nr:MAG: hypothetical protein M1837_003914 [Sclerophora amabilis]